MSKDVKLSKRCQIVKHLDYGGGSQKNKLTQWGSQILTSILMSDMKVIEIAQKYFLWTFWGFLVTIICDVKIDVNICERHYVNFFLWTSSIVQVFDFVTFDIFLTTWHLLTFWHITWSISAHDWLGFKGYMWPSVPRTPVPHCPCGPCPVPHTPLPYCPCGPYPCTPCPHTPLPMYPIAHVAHTPCTHTPCAPLPMWQ